MTLSQVLTLAILCGSFLLMCSLGLRGRRPPVKPAEPDFKMEFTDAVRAWSSSQEPLDEFLERWRGRVKPRPPQFAAFSAATAYGAMRSHPEIRPYEIVKIEDGISTVVYRSNVNPDTNWIGKA